MTPVYGAYALISSGLFVSALPFYYVYSKCSRKAIGPISQRLGVYERPRPNLSGTPRIWIHAVSVGEVNVAGALIQALQRLLPSCEIILTASTGHGHAAALEKLGGRATCLFAPVDFIFSVHKALSTLKPDVLVFLETEIWPNWLMRARGMGIKTALVNGRLSVRSIRGYLRIRPLIKEALACIDAFSMIHEADADRIRLLGAPPGRITVAGNAKYDLLADHACSSDKEKMTRLFRVEAVQPVIVAGSIRGIEGSLILKAFQKIRPHFPQALLILAPRHLKRVPELSEQVRRLGFSCQLRTEIDGGRPRTASVIILDTMGELQAAYGIATVVFCGGSLVPLGGQNVLEAAVWGKPVLYGPSMDDFLEAKELLESAGAGVSVRDGNELAEKMLSFLFSPETAAAVGQRAREAVLSRHGAADKHARVIYEML